MFPVHIEIASLIALVVPHYGQQHVRNVSTPRVGCGLVLGIGPQKNSLQMANNLSQGFVISREHYLLKCLRLGYSVEVNGARLSGQGYEDGHSRSWMLLDPALNGIQSG